MYRAVLSITDMRHSQGGSPGTGDEAPPLLLAERPPPLAPEGVINSDFLTASRNICAFVSAMFRASRNPRFRRKPRHCQTAKGPNAKELDSKPSLYDSDISRLTSSTP